MSKLIYRGFTSADAAAFVARESQGHTLRWLARTYRWKPGTGAEETLLSDVPIISGTLTVDSSNPSRRELTMEVGGGEAYAPHSYLDPLVPFGQFIRLWCTIDRADGTWFPWLRMGDFPIQTYTFERPSLIGTVECQDLSARVDQYLHLAKTSYKDVSLSNAIIRMCRASMPDASFKTIVANGAQNKIVKNYVAEAGSGRWETAVKLASVYGFETFFDSNGNLVVRNAITNDYDNVTPGVGPDIGTITNPVATIRDGEGGNLIGLTATTTRTGAANGVRINLIGTVTKKKKEVDWVGHVGVTQSTGPAAWGNSFGFLPIVLERNLHHVDSGEVARYQTQAKTILARRRGLIRYLDFDMVGGYELEPDDKVKIIVAGHTEDHYVQSVTYDLAGKNATRVRTRNLAVVDPGDV